MASSQPDQLPPQVRSASLLSDSSSWLICSAYAALISGLCWDAALAETSQKYAPLRLPHCLSIAYGKRGVLQGCKLPAAKEFSPVKDPQDGYSFVYPYGWQEVAVKGQDIVYKDVIEPLESVSVSITQTDKADVTEFGSPAEVRCMPSQQECAVAPAQGQVPWCRLLEVPEVLSDGCSGRMS